SLNFGLRIISFNLARLAAYLATVRARLASRSTIDVFAIFKLYLLVTCTDLAAKGKFEGAQQGTTLIIVSSSSGNRNVHSTNAINFVKINFRKNNLLRNAHGKITTTIKLFGAD